MELKAILLPWTWFISKSRVACVQTLPPLKKIREWASVCTRDSSRGASSSNVESYNSGIIITKNLVHFILLLKDQ